MTKAETLEAALNVFNPELALKTKDELDEYFVERPLSQREDLRLLLTATTGKEKFLFTGHRGSGKSTELFKLAQELRQSTGPFFFPVNYSIKSEVNFYDLTYVDVLLSIGLQLFQKATGKKMSEALDATPDQKTQISPEVLRNILNFTKDISRETQISAVAGGELGAEVSTFAGKLSAKLRTEDQTRLTVREKVNSRIADLLENIDLLVRETERVTHRRTVVIIEEFDKLDPGLAKKLFYEHAMSLSSPPVSIIYTFPISLRHENDFMQVEASFPNTYSFPNLKTHNEDHSPNKEGRSKLRNIVTKRAAERLFVADALDELVVLSSGLPKELISITRRACLAAIRTRKPAVDLECVHEAAGHKRRDYQILLSEEQLRLLMNVKASKNIRNDAEHRALLHNLSLLEYRNGDVWYDVNQVVVPLIPAEAKHDVE